MFAECTNLQTIKLSNFKPDNLEHADYMFINCVNLENIDFPKFEISDKHMVWHMTVTNSIEKDDTKKE